MKFAVTSFHGFCFSNMVDDGLFFMVAHEFIIIDQHVEMVHSLSLSLFPDLS